MLNKITIDYLNNLFDISNKNNIIEDIDIYLNDNNNINDISAGAVYININKLLNNL